MNSIINVGFLLVLTCLTGSICMVLWLVAAAVLQKSGNAQLIYRLLKLVMWGYTMPLVYILLFGWNRFMTSEGWILVSTPVVKLVLNGGLILWIIGVIVYIMFQLPMIYGFKQIRKCRIYATVEMTKVLERLKREMGVRKNIILYQGYMVISPFICGFRHTEIYIPVGILDEREMEIILCHELIHHKQRDTFWKPVFAIVNGLFWFNPLVWVVSRKMQRWAEASCDEACCRNSLTVKEYFGTIINMVTSETWRSGSYSPLWAEGENELMWRIGCAKRNSRDGKRSWIAVIVAIIMIVGSCMSVYTLTMKICDFYDKLFRGTRSQLEEAVFEVYGIEYAGITDEFFGGMTIEEMSEATIKSMDWTFESMEVKETASFGKKNGDTIDISGIVRPKDIIIQVGIIEPDNCVRYIDAKNSYSYTFNLTKTGDYKICIRNANNINVNIDGYYD